MSLTRKQQDIVDRMNRMSHRSLSHQEIQTVQNVRHPLHNQYKMLTQDYLSSGCMDFTNSQMIRTEKDCRKLERCMNLSNNIANIRFDAFKLADDYHGPHMHQIYKYRNLGKTFQKWYNERCPLVHGGGTIDTPINPDIDDFDIPPRGGRGSGRGRKRKRTHIIHKRSKYTIIGSRTGFGKK